MRGVSDGSDGVGRRDERRRVDVAEDGRRAGRRDRLRARVERERRDDDLVARPDADRPQRDRDRLGAVRDADDVLDAEPRGELALERLDLRAEDVAAVVEHPSEAAASSSRSGAQRGLGVEQADGHDARHGTLPPPVTVLASLTDPLVDFAVNVIDALGLPGVFVLMLLESACIPIPSEATMLFAGFNVADGEYSLIAATLVGDVREPRRLLDRVRGRLLRPRRRPREARPQAAHQAEPPRVGRPLVRAPRRRDRLLQRGCCPIIRTFVSLPAGVARMPFWRFIALHACSGAFPGCSRWRSSGKQVGDRWDDWKDKPPLRRLRRRRSRSWRSSSTSS